MGWAVAGYLGVSCVGFMLGGLFLKRFADNGLASELIVSFTAYALANVVFARVLAHGLSLAMVASSMAQLVLMSIVGALIFGERFGGFQIAGLACACAALWLFTKGAGSA